MMALSAEMLSVLLSVDDVSKSGRLEQTLSVGVLVSCFR